MRFDEYQKGVLRTASMGRSPDLALAVFSLGLCGEAAELYDALDSTPENEEKEAGDVLWYTAALTHALGITSADLEVDDLTQVFGINQSPHDSARSLMFSACVIAELCKKKIGHNKEPDRARLIREFKVIINRLASVVSETDLGFVAELNLAKLKKRYPNGWDIKIAEAKPDGGEASTVPGHFPEGSMHFDSTSGEWKPGPV